MRALWVLPLLALAFAGCVGNEPDVPGGTTIPELLKPATVPLWNNPQTTPHPAFNFPTLSHPANGSNVPEFWKPIPALALPNPIVGMTQIAQATPVKSGAGMSVFGSLAVVPGFGGPTHIWNISDPAKPTLLSTIPKENHRNVDFIPYPDGRLVAVFSTGGGTLPVYNITDPRHPQKVMDLSPASGTHKVNVVPGTPMVYNAHSSGGNHVESQANAITEVYDLGNLSRLEGGDYEPPQYDFPNGFGCHHIYFWLDASKAKYRAICAGIESTQLWDIKDPFKPEVIVTIPVHHGRPEAPSNSIPIVMFSHFGILNYAGTVLIVGDEMGGGGIPPGCVAGAGVPGTAWASTPFGALWFYDVSDEKNPLLLGWFSPGEHLATNPDNAAASCTAHHGRLVPDPGKRDLLAMAFYGAGVALIDFTNPTTPKLIDQFNDGTDTWEVQYYNGYLFTGDLNRGMDVLKFR